MVTMTKLRKAYQGFTIVEVLIVLAIAGLIILIVFFAVPELKRVERNNKRKTAVSHVISELNIYYATRGTYPFGSSSDNRDAFINQIQNTGITQHYTYRYNPNWGSHEYPYAGSDAPANLNDAMDEISILPAHKCNRDPSLGPGDLNFPTIETSLGDTDLKAVAVWTILEGAPAFCLDSEN